MDEQQARAVIRGLNEGRADAWKTLYDAFAERVWRGVARLLGPNSADVADVVQETMLAAARSAHSFDAARGSLWLWLWGIARLQVALHYRKQKRHDRLKQAGDWLAASNGRLARWLDGTETAPPDLVEAAELSLLVRCTLLELPDDYESLLTAKYFDGDSIEQIAGRERSTATALRSKLARAREAFRQTFARLTGGTVYDAEACNEHPDPLPTDEQLVALLAAADKDAPPPDRALLDRLRQQSTAAFQTALPQSTPFSPRKRTMILSSLRWIAAAAAVLVVGIVVAQWIVHQREPEPENVAPEATFVVNEKLIDDGRIGKVTDAQGVVAVKPVLHERWSPVQPRLVLKPGDWLRTDARGANAVALKLIKATRIIVGPHSTVELIKAAEIHLLEGEIEITATADAPVELQGPDKQPRTVKSKQLFRVEKEKLVRVEKEPRWLAGFKGTTANESIGSLIATVDGREVPLTVGFHHVTVDVRDQIARTVIEESFVNRTKEVLEGVFYFPLPQDASISGFGMWIGDQLVEADVVEKQRAREIYETILREKRDPGLLEWTGGNIFKARVYPIPGLSEKRIKISYTQVLPKQGNRYRYSYGLQSELLRQHPLRDLSIDFTVNSAVPLKSVSSPTHTARVAKTEHSGHVEFSAQEYVPTRDFEAVIEVEGQPSSAVVIPHRRGDDGYFMVQLTPPGTSLDLDRPLIPNGDPLRLLLLADTSASMDRGQRATQNAVLASLLGALTPKDTINVAACDVNCDWIFDKPVAATSANIATIREVLAKRSSLGWTDLDKAFASAMKISTPGTHVIYLGDGIVTTGDADPVAFAKRLQRLYDGKSGTFHAVTVGSSYEPAALKAIAALGGGSVRRVSGEQGPQAVALELLGEIATPTLRNLKVEFTGVRTARVYPEELPNVAAGTQQILLGRYLPEGKDQAGEIVVTGMLGDKPVRFTSKITLANAEKGNSFIPRLWARMHLDKLLEQGSSAAIQQDIIALSEEYQIITPYTSFLVLESDADRERFAVKRRFQMRDGEKFFAEGRDNASFELKQQQMKQAGDYRTALRRKVLAQLMTLGRDVRLFQNPAPSRRPTGEAYSVSDVNGTTIQGMPVGGFVADGRTVWNIDDLSENAYGRRRGGDPGWESGHALKDAEAEDDFKLSKDRKDGEFLEKALSKEKAAPISESPDSPANEPQFGRAKDSIRGFELGGRFDVDEMGKFSGDLYDQQEICLARGRLQPFSTSGAFQPRAFFESGVTDDRRSPAVAIAMARLALPVAGAACLGAEGSEIDVARRGARPVTQSVASG